MRAVAALTLLLASACSTLMLRSEDDRVITTIGLPVDTVLRIAATQLQHHGFQVYELGGGNMITAPQAVPSHLAPPGAEGQQWIVRVSAEPLSFVRGTQVEVRGYTVPEGVRVVSDNQISQNAIPVTTARNPRLFREIEAVAGWINDAGARQRRAQ